MAKHKILYWHDIPTQVRATDENGRAGKPLSDRFQLAIDNAAMEADIIGSNEYTDGFQWGDEQERPGSAAEVAEAVVTELEEKYTKIDWRGTAKRLKGTE